MGRRFYAADKKLLTNRKIKKYGLICHCGRFKQSRTNCTEANDLPRNLSEQNLRELFKQSLTSKGIQISKRFQPTHGTDIKNCYICRFNPTRTAYSLYDMPLFLNVTTETRDQWKNLCYQEVDASADGCIFVQSESGEDQSAPILSQETERLFEFYTYVYMLDQRDDIVLLKWFDD